MSHWGTNSPLHIAARALCPDKTLTEHMPTLGCHWSDNVGKPPHYQNTDIHWSVPTSHWDTNSPLHAGTRTLVPNTTLTECMPTLDCDRSDNIVELAHNQSTDIGPCQRRVGVGPTRRRLQRACRGPTFRTRRCLCRSGAGPHKVFPVQTVTGAPQG